MLIKWVIVHVKVNTQYAPNPQEVRKEWSRKSTVKPQPALQQYS